MEYRFNTASSRALDERLQRTLPGGNTRSVIFYLPYPLALARGAGYRVWDVDGNEFVDFVNNYTSLVHGHAAPEIVAALTEQAALGTAFAAPTELQAELAERICGRIASIERLRFVNSGSEANMAAVRVARAFTGRDEIVKAYEGYHGNWEQVPQVKDYHEGSYDALLRETGVPQAVQNLVHMVPYNDVAALEAAMQQYGRQVAAILLEPVLFSGGVIAGAAEFFAAARALADTHGALLICDEVVTARLRRGGYQDALGVRPDLTTLGKIIGGGLPVGAVGGRADVMDLFNPRRPNAIPHSGTFNGNQMTMAAGCVSLDLLTAAEIDRINALGEALAARLGALLAAAGLDARVTACGSLLQVHCADAGVLARLHLAALEQGIYFAPRGLLNISTPMDDAVIEQALAALGRAVEQVAASPQPV